MIRAINPSGNPFGYNDTAGLWLVDTMRFSAMVAALGGADIFSLNRPGRGQSQVSLWQAERRGALAIVNVSGVLTKFPSLLGGSATTDICDMVREAADDPSIRGILLKIDSIGGSEAGIKTLADEIVEADKKKPVYAYLEDSCVGSAFWIASQARKVYANPTAVIGSIGSYAVAYDSSEAAKKAGVVVHVIKAGEFKGAGTPGTVVTDKQLSMWQTRVDAIEAVFVADIARGRHLTAAKAKELATGDVWIGEKAKAVGLIDGVQSFDATLAELQALVSSETAKQTKASAPGVSPVRSEIKAAVTPTVRPTIPVEKKEPPMPTATELWNQAIHAKMTQGKSREAATAELSRENPGLRERWVAEFNTTARAEENHRLGR